MVGWLAFIVHGWLTCIHSSWLADLHSLFMAGWLAVFVHGWLTCSLCSSGENVLALVRALVANPCLVDPGDHRHGTLVFFDFLGYFVVAYPRHLAILLNWAVVAGTFAMAIHKAVNSSHGRCENLARWTVVVMYHSFASDGHGDARAYLPVDVMKAFPALVKNMLAFSCMLLVWTKFIHAL